jgi:hypothetical protein
MLLLPGCANQGFGQESDGSFTVADVMEQGEPIESTESDVPFGEVDPDEEPDPVALGIAAEGDPDDPLSASSIQQRDSVEKADIYWKLNYLKEAVASGDVPPDMELQLEEIRTRIEATEDDETKGDLLEAANLFRAGLDAHRLDEKLRSAGGSRSLSGATASLRPGYKRPPAKPKLSVARSKLLDGELEAFTRQHHAKPSFVKTLSFSQAGLKTTAIAEKLDLRDPDDKASAILLGPKGNPHLPDEAD